MTDPDYIAQAREKYHEAIGAEITKLLRDRGVIGGTAEAWRRCEEKAVEFAREVSNG